MAIDNEKRPKKFLYEERPFLYLLFALVGFGFGRGSKIAIVSAVFLLLASLAIYGMRHYYRAANKQIDKKYQKKD